MTLVLGFLFTFAGGMAIGWLIGVASGESGLEAVEAERDRLWDQLYLKDGTAR